MRIGQEQAEQLISQAVTLFAKDTVFAGLGVMQEHRLGRVAVVREESGELLGEVSVEDLYRAWSTDPFMSVGEVVGGVTGPAHGWAIFGVREAAA